MNRRKQTSMWLAVAVAAALAGAACGGSGKSAKAPEVEDGYEPTGKRSGGPGVDDDDDDRDDGMAVAGLRGRLDPHDIQRGLEPHAGKLTGCYTRLVGKDHHLGGRIQLKFFVHPDGTVKSVQIAESDLGAWRMEQCLLEVSQAMTFPKPKGNAEAEFSLPLSFDATRGTGYWDEARAGMEVAERLPELATCAGAPGAAVVTLYVGARGKVLSVGFATPEGLLDPAWAACAAGVITGWTLTDPRGQITKASFGYAGGM